MGQGAGTLPHKIAAVVCCDLALRANILFQCRKTTQLSRMATQSKTTHAMSCMPALNRSSYAA